MSIVEVKFPVAKTAIVGIDGQSAYVMNAAANAAGNATVGLLIGSAASKITSVRFEDDGAVHNVVLVSDPAVVDGSVSSCDPSRVLYKDASGKFVSSSRQWFGCMMFYILLAVLLVLVIAGVMYYRKSSSQQQSVAKSQFAESDEKMINY